MAEATATHSNQTHQKPLTLADVMAFLVALDAKVDVLGKSVESFGSTGRGARQSQKEMTDDDARKVLTELADLKHNDAADKLGLSYGQVYSCRLGYTFKNIRKELLDNKVTNQWLERTHAD